MLFKQSSKLASRAIPWRLTLTRLTIKPHHL